MTRFTPTAAASSNSRTTASSRRPNGWRCVIASPDSPRSRTRAANGWPPRSSHRRAPTSPRCARRRWPKRPQILGDEASVTSVVSSAVLAELVSLYQPVGQRNYKTIADRFDQAARSFTAAVSICDPAVDSSAVIRLSERERSAWLGAEVCANELDELLQPLAAAAFLAGAPGAICVLNEDAAALQLPLTVDVDKLHVRKAWAAWADTTTRCGRWAAIHRLGAKSALTALQTGCSPTPNRSR